MSHAGSARGRTFTNAPGSAGQGVILIAFVLWQRPTRGCRPYAVDLMMAVTHGAYEKVCEFCAHPVSLMLDNISEIYPLCL